MGFSLRDALNPFTGNLLMAAYKRMQQKKNNTDATNAGAALIDGKATPEMTLSQLQLQQLKDEQEWNSLMRPQLLKNMGLTEEVGTDGKKTLRAMTEEEKVAGMTPEEKSAYDTEQIIAERQAKAARGELDVPTYVQDELNKQRGIQSNLSSARLGAKGASLSTAGINAKVNQMGNEAAVKSNYQYGQDQTGMGLLGQYGSYLGNQNATNQNLFGNFSNAGTSIIPMAQTATQPYTFGRQLQDENDLMGEQRRNAMVGGIMSGIGTAASIYTSKGMGGK